MENKQCNPYLIKVIKSCIEGYNDCSEKGAQSRLKYIMGQAPAMGGMLGMPQM